MPLPSNLTSKRAFDQRYVESYSPANLYNLVRTALFDLSDDPNYEPLNYDVSEELDDEEADEKKIYPAFNNAFKNDKVIAGFVSEFSDKSANEPYFTDAESYNSFMKSLYNYLCEKIWGKLQQKYPESADFNEDFVNLDENPVNGPLEDDQVTEIMSVITGLIEGGRLTLPEGVSKKAVSETLSSLKKCVTSESTIMNGPEENRLNRFNSNRRAFADNLRELDKILAPGLVKGEDAIFNDAYYLPVTDYRSDISYVLNERLNAIRDFGNSEPEKGNVEKMMKEHFVLPDNIIGFRNKALSKLIKCREELLASDHFFQKSSQEFKDMKDALDEAIRGMRSIGKADYKKIDSKKIRESISAQLKNVSEKTSAYLIYKEDGPTGFFGASRVAAAKGIRDAIRSLKPAMKNSEIMNDCKNNITDIFGDSKAINPENTDFNLSEVSRKIAGYIAPCSGTDLGRIRSVYLFTEDFERDYAFAKSNRIDLVLDYIKHPGEATALKNRVEVTKNNYMPVKDAKVEDLSDIRNDLGYRYVGVSYAIKGLIDKIREKKSPDTDVVILGEMVKVLNEDLNKIKDVELPEKFRSAIDENTRYVEAVIVTTDFLKEAMSLEEKGKLIGSLKGDPNAKREYTNKEYNALMKTSTNDVKLNTILGYSYFKSFKGGMNAVIGMVEGFQKASPEWSWEQTAEKLRERNPEIEKTFNELLAREKNEKQKEVNGKSFISGGSGHIMRNYSTVVNGFEKIFEAKNKKVNENDTQAVKSSGPVMK